VFSRIIHILLALGAFGFAAQAEMPEEWPSFIEERCEIDWPAATSTTRDEAELCARYWLKRYVYGNHRIESIGDSPNLPEHWVDGGHYNGGQVETIATADQFRQMIRHVKAALPTEGPQGLIRQYATTYLQGALRARFTLSGMSSISIPSITPQLSKVLKGQRLRPEDLLCRTQVTLWKLESAIFARHGGPLSHPDMTTFFYGKRTAQLRGLRKSHLLPLRTDAAFSPDQLTEIDRDNLQLLHEVGDLNQQTRCQSPENWGIAARY